MTRAELDAAVARLKLNVPAGERDEIAAGAGYIEKMAALLRKPRWVGAEPSHIVTFPKE
jgi:hypothetical protein